MSDFDENIKKEFINTALIDLEESEEAFMELETGSDRKKLLDRIFRLAHSLKGDSRAVGFGDVAEFTHLLESLVSKIQRSEMVLSPEMITTLLRANDRLVEMLTTLKVDMTAKFDNADIIGEVNSWLEGKTPVAPPAPVAAPVAPPPASASVLPEPPPVEESVVVNDISQAEAEFFVVDAEPQPVEPVSTPVPPPSVRPGGNGVVEAKSEAKGKEKSSEKDGEIVRVNLSRIDLLNDYVGELIVLQSVIQQQAANTGRHLQASLRQMVKLSKDIQSLSMSLRMLPVKPLVQKLQRVVRDTAQALGKEINFHITGDGLDIDKSVLDRLADPLIHILRNAVDHGVEDTAERKNVGKSPAGRLSLSFSNEGNHLVVEVKDDGKGIDSQVLRRKGVEKGLITQGQSLTERQLINLIFHPGFSTKDTTSEISGRGVGMDVVKTNVEKIGGQVDVTTEVGKGSQFRLQIPLSLAVIEGLVVTSGTNRYVVPLNQVQETINLRTHTLFESKLGIGACFELRGHLVPLFNIENALGPNSAKADAGKIDPSHTGLIVSIRDQLMALVVKDVVRAQQVVIKPLGNGINAQKGWIGSCVLGDGLPTLIVSPVDLLDTRDKKKQAEQSTGGAA